MRPIADEPAPTTELARELETLWSFLDAIGGPQDIATGTRLARERLEHSRAIRQDLTRGASPSSRELARAVDAARTAAAHLRDSTPSA